MVQSRATTFERSANPIPFKTIGLAVAVFFGLIVVWDGYYTVDATKAAVVKQFGSITDVTFEGLHFKLPFAQKVVEIDLTQQKTTYDDVEAYSSDRQTAMMRATVQWHVDRTKIPSLNREYIDTKGIQSKLIDSNMPTYLKNVFGHYTAVSAINDRPKLNTEITEAVKASVGGAPVIIDAVNIENIVYDDSYLTAIKARNEAEVSVLTKEQELKKAEVEARIKVAQANGMANSVRAQAEGDRDAAIAAGIGKASAIKAVSEALTANPGYLELARIDKWTGGVPTNMVPGSAVPFISLPSPAAH